MMKIKVYHSVFQGKSDQAEGKISAVGEQLTLGVTSGYAYLINHAQIIGEQTPQRPKPIS